MNEKLVLKNHLREVKKGQNKFCPWRLIIFDDYRFFNAV